MRATFFLLGLGAVSIMGCGGSTDSDLFADAGGAPDTSTLDVSVPDVDTTDVIAPPDASTVDACVPGCSDDLHGIVDCNGNPVQPCPGDQGCKAGACVPACDAFAARPGSVGCDFYSVDPDVIQGFGLEGACFAVAIVNPWTSDATLTVDRAGSTLSPDGFGRIVQGSGKSITYAPLTGSKVPAGATAVLFLARSNGGNPACPNGITPALTVDPAVHGTGLGSAFHITSSSPVSAWDFAPYAAGSLSTGVGNATMLYPTTAWSTNYLVVDAYEKSLLANGVPSTDIVALADNTQVTIKPVANIPGGGGVTAAAAGASTVYTLGKGQILQITQNEELTGSPIEASKPVGVWGAHTCMNIDPSVGFCDPGHQQLPPVAAMGSEYVGVRYRGRDGTEETPPWRMVGVVDGTVLTWDPSPPSGAPSTLSAKQLVNFKAAGPFHVRSQDAAHPFYLSAHMSGGSAFAGKGDPEFVNVITPPQWTPSYAFFTDPAFPESNLVFIRKKGASGFADVTLDCAGKLTGWAPVGAGGLYEFVRADLSTGDFVAQASCNNGPHTAKSTAPFTVTAWGWGSAMTSTYTGNNSYAVTAGALAAPLNGVVFSAK
jgi:hypothetical protein